MQQHNKDDDSNEQLKTVANKNKHISEARKFYTCENKIECKIC